MKWSKVQLLKYKNVGLEFDEILKLENLKKRDPQILSISPVRVRGRADITENKVTFHMTITGELILPSSRTLKEVNFPLNIKATETFLFTAGVDLGDESEFDSHIIEGDMVNLIPVVEELILLEIPMQIYGEDEELPDFFRSGKDWEFIQDEDQWKKEKIDPRLSKLAELLNNDGK